MQYVRDALGLFLSTVLERSSTRSLALMLLVISPVSLHNVRSMRPVYCEDG